MVVALLLVIIGILLSFTGVGAIIGIPIAILGAIFFVLAMIKSAAQSIGRTGRSPRR